MPEYYCDMFTARFLVGFFVFQFFCLFAFENPPVIENYWLGLHMIYIVATWIQRDLFCDSVFRVILIDICLPVD